MESSINLISANRLDVFTKTPLAYAWANGVDQSWGLELYMRYMLATRPKNGFSEDNSKFSINDYLNSFRSIFNSIESFGFDNNVSTIPIGSLGITNGAHRLATTLVLGKDVATSQSSDSDHFYDSKYMKTIGLPASYIDACVLEMINYSKKFTVFCAMSISEKLAEQIEKCLELKNFSIVHVKALNLSKIGQRRLMKILYGKNKWWSNELYETLALERFGGEKSSYFYFVLSKSHQEEVDFKSELRNKFFGDFMHKKLHSTDTHLEARHLGQAILNLNSLLFLNEAPIDSEVRLIEMIKNHQVLQFKDPNSFAIDGSANLELFGIRKANDLDFIELTPEITETLSTDNHNSEYQNLPINPSRLILDPRNFAFIEGFKFVNIAQTVAFKAQRSEAKDLEDIASLCSRSISGIVYNKKSGWFELFYLRARLKLRRKVNKVLSPLPPFVQSFIRNLYVNVRNFMS